MILRAGTGTTLKIGTTILRFNSLKGIAMFFVHKFVDDGYGRVIENNVRLGGFRTREAAIRAVKRNAPAVCKDDTRTLIAQSVSPAAPNYYVQQL